MKTLVVYYSRDGHTRKVAEALKAKLKTDCVELKEVESRAGIMGWLRAGRDALSKKLTTLVESNIVPMEYDLVIIGTPVWAYTMTCAIRTWLSQQGKRFPTIAFFATMGGSGAQSTFAHMEELCGWQPLPLSTRKSLRMLASIVKP